MLSLIDPQSALNWLILAALLGVAEILLPSTIAIGFGLGAGLTALVLWVVGPDVFGTPAVFVLWAFLSGLAWLGLRRVFRNRHVKDTPYDGDINDY